MAETLDPLSVEKLEAVKRFKRINSWKKFIRYFVLCSVPMIICFYFFDWKAVLPSLRVVCMVKIPGIWHFCSNQRFLFLLSNVIIVSLAAKSGLLNPSDGGADLYDEFLRRSKMAQRYYVPRPVLAEENAVNGQETGKGSLQTKYGRSKSEIVKGTAPQSERNLRRSESEQTARRRRNQEEAVSNDESEADIPDEELNRKVEEFIAKFQREIRLQREPSFVRY